MYPLLLVCGLALGIGVVRAAALPFWSDEISTTRIAAMPTWKAVFEGTQQLDLNPPLEVFLVRASSMVLGPRELAGRVPSLFGYVLTIGCLFVLLRRRFSPWFAAFGALLLLQNTATFYYATEARPYALLLGMLGLVLVGYDTICTGEGSQNTGRILLFLGSTGMILTHVFAVFPMMGLVAAEALRTRRLHRADVLTWLSLLLPLCFCVLYIPLIKSHGHLVYPLGQRATLTSGIHVYVEFFLMPIARVLGVGLVILLFVRNYPDSGFVSWLKMPLEEWVLWLAVLATPVSVALLMIVRFPLSGYYPRYGLPMVYPGAFFLVAWFAWRSRNEVRVARALTVVVLLAIFYTYHEDLKKIPHLMHRGWLAAPIETTTTGGVEQIYPELPLVANNAQEFLEADNRLTSEQLKRLYYVSDEQVALRLTHVNVLETLQYLKEPFHIRASFAGLGGFTAEHKEFLVIGDINFPGSWFLRWALEQHADICFLGRYKFAGAEMPLWHVTLKPGTQEDPRQVRDTRLIPW